MPSQYMQERRSQLMQDGRCVDCHKPKGANRQTVQRCCGCQKKKNHHTAVYKQPSMVKRGLILDPGPRSGWIHCKRCKELGKKTRFWSDDYRRITRCEKCQRWMVGAEESLTCEGARYEAIDKTEGFESVRNKLTCKTGPMTSAKQKAIQANRMAKDQVGVTCRHLTRQEIEDRYTPEYCANLLKRSAQNASGMYRELKSL